MRINCDLPPPYEQAIKYPSLVSIPTGVGHCNPALISNETLNLSPNVFGQDSSHQSSSSVVRNVRKSLSLDQCSSSSRIDKNMKDITKPPDYVDSV